MSALFRDTDRYNLDKKQAIIGALLMMQKPGYTGPGV